MKVRLSIVSLILVSFFLADISAHASQRCRLFKRKAQIAKMYLSGGVIFPSEGHGKRPDEASSSSRNENPKGTPTLPSTTDISAAEDLPASDRADTKRFESDQTATSQNLVSNSTAGQELKAKDPFLNYIPRNIQNLIFDLTENPELIQLLGDSEYATAIGSRVTATTEPAERMRILDQLARLDPVPAIAKGEGSQDSKYPDEKVKRENVAAIGKLLAETDDSKVADELHRYFGEKLGGDQWNCEYLNGLTSKDLFSLMTKSSLLKGRIFQCVKTLKPEILDGLVTSKLNIADLDRLMRGILINPTRSYSSRAVTHVFNRNEKPSPELRWQNLVNVRYAVLPAGPDKDILKTTLRLLRLPRLEMLELTGGEIDRKILDELIKVMDRHPITHLRLSSVGMESMDLIFLCQYLAKYPHLQSVQFLDVDYGFHAYSEKPEMLAREAGITTAILKIVAQSETLKHLDYLNWGVRTLGIDFIAAFVKDHPQITQLRLAGERDLPLAFLEFDREGLREPDFFFEFRGAPDYTLLAHSLRANHSASTVLIRTRKYKNFSDHVRGIKGFKKLVNESDGVHETIYIKQNN